VGVLCGSVVDLPLNDDHKFIISVILLPREQVLYSYLNENSNNNSGGFNNQKKEKKKEKRNEVTYKV